MLSISKRKLSYKRSLTAKIFYYIKDRHFVSYALETLCHVADEGTKEVNIIMKIFGTVHMVTTKF